MAYGAKIREFRKFRGLTQWELARAIGNGTTNASISEYENDKIEIPASRLIAIARILNVSIYELTGEKPPDVRKAAEAAREANIDQLLAALKEKGFPDQALEFARLLHEKQLDDWQIEAIRAILEKSKK